MHTERNFVDEIKHQYKHGGMTIRLVFINLSVFLLISFLEIFARLIGGSAALTIASFSNNLFVLQTDFLTFLTHPWGIITSIFAHFSFMHFLFNMIFLYYAGKMFEEHFDQNRLLYTYILGGIFGGVLEMLAHLVFPGLSGSSAIVGASGSIMAIFIALAFYRPNLVVHLFGLLRVRLIFIALAFFLKDLFYLGMNDGIAHFAHIGGAILGVISIQRPHSSSNIILAAERIGNKVKLFFNKLIQPNKTAKMNVQQGGNKTRFQTDEEYNKEKKQRQKQTDAILDKISKSGYDSLTKAEKEFLFQQGNK